jgi:hypothetical protein
MTRATQQLVILTSSCGQDNLIAARRSGGRLAAFTIELVGAAAERYVNAVPAHPIAAGWLTRPHGGPGTSEHARSR